MSTAQMKASQQFLDAMGPMILDEKKMMQVIVYINTLVKSSATISQEKFDSLKTIDELDAHLEARINNHYQCVEA